MSISFDFSLLLNPIFTETVIYALMVGFLTCLCASVLGVNLVLKRYSMIGDGLSHVGFLALGICALLEISGDKTIYITFPVVIAAAFLLMWLSKNGKLKGDAATAIVSTGTVAVGYILFEFAEAGTGDICSGLFGASILTLQSSDMLQSIIMAAMVLTVYILFYKKFFAITFDESFVRASGVNVGFYNGVLSLLTAVTVVVGMKLIGSIMISAVVVIPAVAAMRLFKNFKRVVVASALISVTCFILGLIFAFSFVVTNPNGNAIQLPVGATIVCFNIIALIIASIIKKKDSHSLKNLG